MKSCKATKKKISEMLVLNLHSCGENHCGPCARKVQIKRENFILESLKT